VRIAKQVDWVYDFALPPLVLHAFFESTARHLKHWIGIRPLNALTVLDTHDGIGVIDVAADANEPGLLPAEGIDRLVRRIHENSGGESLQATGAAASNLDLYQVNCTFYDALARDDVRYLLSRAIQFFLPGIPQVYYVGLLVGTNDMALLARTGVGRDINRHYYTRDEIGQARSRPVVADLVALIRLRNEHPAFQGRFELATTVDTVLDARWSHHGATARLRIDFASGEHRIGFSGPQAPEHFQLLNVAREE
jgi:sucrose phosphorylase